MWMKMSHGQSGRPASSTSTRVDGSALSRLASTHPAEPPPTMMKSYVVMIAAGRDDGPERRVPRAGPSPSSSPPYETQGCHVALFASTHFVAAAAIDMLSAFLYVVTVFWSSAVQFIFFRKS